GIGGLGTAGKNLRRPRLEFPLVCRNAVPTRHRLVAWRELRVRRNPAELLLPLERALAQFIPALVELALVHVGPFLEDVVRTVRRARRPVHQKRLVRRVSPILAEPGYGL